MALTENTPCTYCGMTGAAGEYHPYGVCLMMKACNNSGTVRANLAEMREHFQAEVRKEDEALIRQMLEALVIAYPTLTSDGLRSAATQAITAARARLQEKAP